jgi:hypothetical protein
LSSLAFSFSLSFSMPVITSLRSHYFSHIIIIDFLLHIHWMSFPSKILRLVVIAISSVFHFSLLKAWYLLFDWHTSSWH